MQHQHQQRHQRRRQHQQGHQRRQQRRQRHQHQHKQRVRYVMDIKIKEALEANSLVPFSDQILTILLVFLALGVFAGIVGSLIILNKYLKKEGSEFRAL